MARAALKERTYVDDLTDTLEALRTASARLHAVRLTTLRRPIAAEVKKARKGADDALQATIDAIRLDAGVPTRRSA